jgi:hypothetical protein
MKPKSKKKKTKIATLNDYPPELRGPPQNRFGGHRTEAICGFRGNTYGAASECVTYTEEQKQAWLTAHTSIHHA